MTCFIVFFFTKKDQLKPGVNSIIHQLTNEMDEM